MSTKSGLLDDVSLQEHLRDMRDRVATHETATAIEAHIAALAGELARIRSGESETERVLRAGLGLEPVVAGCASAAEHRRALTKARNEGLTAAVTYLRSLFPEHTIMPTSRAIVMNAATTLDGMKEPE